MRVSILTGCPQPVQLAGVRPDADGDVVSILTGCPQPVQPPRGCGVTWTRGFQSSPAALSRCNACRWTDRCPRPLPVSILTGCPQPVQHPPPAIVADFLPNKVSILTGCPQPVQPAARPARQTGACSFNPHRLPSAGATTANSPPSPCTPHRFQSSPAALSRCNQVRVLTERVTELVSILTGCPQPVQRV